MSGSDDDLEDKRLLKEKNDDQFSKAFIYEPKKNESLAQILSNVKRDKFYGDIKWPNDDFDYSNEFVDEIEEQLEMNNDEFTRFPSDLTHAQMSSHVYNYKNLNEGDEVDFNKEFVVHKKFFKHTGIIGEGNTVSVAANTVPVYVAILYLNKTRKQLVLATKGIEASILKSHFSSHDTLTNSLKGILCNETIPQLYVVRLNFKFLSCKIIMRLSQNVSIC
jgi:hypothetical protein